MVEFAGPAALREGQFITSWNVPFTPMIFLQRMVKRAVMVALATLMGRYTGAPPCGSPACCWPQCRHWWVYIFFQRQIIRGLSAGAIK